MKFNINLNYYTFLFECNNMQLNVWKHYINFKFYCIYKYVLLKKAFS